MPSSLEDPSGKGASYQGNPVRSKYKTQRPCGRAGKRANREGKEVVVYSIYSESRVSRVRQARQTQVQVLAVLLTCYGSSEQVCGFVWPSYCSSKRCQHSAQAIDHHAVEPMNEIT